MSARAAATAPLTTAGSSGARAGGPARFFLDTNVFVYSFDRESPERKAKARELIEMALTTGLGAISHQGIQEFVNVATTKFSVPLTTRDCGLYLQQVLAPLWRVSPTLGLYERALEIREQSGYCFYDSLIVAAALFAGCNILYSQDLQHGRRFDALTVVDPFSG
jgi:predicted nucleic acid-binding protein